MAQREELEARIKEQRLAEANKKGLTGPTGKIGVVLKVLGEPIVSQMEDASYLNLAGEEEDEGIPIMAVEGAKRPTGPEWSDEGRVATYYGIHEIGRHFDGLSRGMHMEIFYRDESSEMSLYHRGFLAYKESQGNLQCYVPSNEWEGWISSLFKVAKKKQREEKEKEFEERVKESEKTKLSWLHEMASRWGITK
jgi:hypothetical protein